MSQTAMCRGGGTLEWGDGQNSLSCTHSAKGGRDAWTQEGGHLVACSEVCMELWGDLYGWTGGSQREVLGSGLS